MNLLLIDHEDSFTYNLAHLLSGFGNLEVKNFYDIKEKSIKKKKSGGFSSFRNQKWMILRKKKHQKWRILFQNSLFWRKKNTKSGGFCNLKYGRSCLHRVFFTSPENHQKWRSL